MLDYYFWLTTDDVTATGTIAGVWIFLGLYEWLGDWDVGEIDWGGICFIGGEDWGGLVYILWTGI